MYIQVTEVPAGEAPENVRMAWVGVIMLVDEHMTEVVKTSHEKPYGVLSREEIPKNDPNRQGYAVTLADAITALRRYGREQAALWWEGRNIPFGKVLIFDRSFCRQMLFCIKCNDYHSTENQCPA